MTTITARHRHMLEVADRTRDVEVISAIVEAVIAEGVTVIEVEEAFRDCAAQSYLIADPFQIVLGMKEMLDAINAAGITPDDNRAALKALKD
jgi:hypothetical protein